MSPVTLSVIAAIAITVLVISILAINAWKEVSRARIGADKPLPKTQSDGSKEYLQSFDTNLVRIVSLLEDLNLTVRMHTTSQDNFLKTMFGGDGLSRSDFDGEPDGVREIASKLLHRYPDISREEAIMRARSLLVYKTGSPMGGEA